MPDRADRRERILDAALGLMATRGPDGLTLRALGEEAGLHNSSLFHHFRGKKDLHDALAERVIAPLFPRFERLLKDDPPHLDGLASVLEHAMVRWDERPAEAAYLARALAAGPEDPLRGGRESLESRLLRPVWEWLVRARRAGVTRPVSPGPTTLRIFGLVLLEPAHAAAAGERALPPARGARRRELDAWLHAMLAAR